ncbi:hypothetical protein BDW66DRAFT_143215, partial [Aspergillus desertorum]
MVSWPGSTTLEDSTPHGIGENINREIYIGDQTQTRKKKRKKDRRKNKGSTQSSEGIRSLVGYGRVVDTVLFCPPSHEHMLFHN